jgi:hypothetical protein
MVIQRYRDCKASLEKVMKVAKNDEEQKLRLSENLKKELKNIQNNDIQVY